MTLIVRDVGGKNKRRVNVPWEGLATTAQWVEQAGKGGKRKVGRLALVVPSAPPLSRHMKSYLKQVNGSGGALGVNCVRRPTFRLPPFPACSTH